eukprot:gnl/TRDRNA2_/TRDRNA2_177656_c0_seq1.p1 gnl/TRDRNA2_/TRDRNA2_177656_c0~~gnl/TRDRNA2_/TRDRNA2_177656_c0_seq1.p1  ORF type:complete len:601 (-),score=52.47 gnl/TRDRNA2_/TRDRNA2_177656_c0_seq1:250-2052(-)
MIRTTGYVVVQVLHVPPCTAGFVKTLDRCTAASSGTIRKEEFESVVVYDPLAKNASLRVHAAHDWSMWKIGVDRWHLEVDGGSCAMQFRCPSAPVAVQVSTMPAFNDTDGKLLGGAARVDNYRYMFSGSKQSKPDDVVISSCRSPLKLPIYPTSSRAPSPLLSPPLSPPPPSFFSSISGIIICIVAGLFVLIVACAGYKRCKKWNRFHVPSRSDVEASQLGAPSLLITQETAHHESESSDADINTLFMGRLLGSLMNDVCTCVVELDEQHCICEPCPQFANFLLHTESSNGLLNAKFEKFVAAEDLHTFQTCMALEASFLGDTASDDMLPGRKHHCNIRLRDAAHANVRVQLWYVVLKNTRNRLRYIIGIWEDSDEFVTGGETLNFSRQTTAQHSNEQQSSAELKVGGSGSSGIDQLSNTSSESEGTVVTVVEDPNPAVTPQATLSIAQEVVSTNARFDMVFGYEIPDGSHFGEHFLMEAQLMEFNLWFQSCVNAALRSASAQRTWTIPMNTVLFRGTRRSTECSVIFQFHFGDPMLQFGPEWTRQNHSDYLIQVFISSWKKLPREQRRAARAQRRASSASAPSLASPAPAPSQASKCKL